MAENLATLIKTASNSSFSSSFVQCLRDIKRGQNWLTVIRLWKTTIGDSRVLGSWSLLVRGLSQAMRICALFERFADLVTRNTNTIIHVKHSVAWTWNYGPGLYASVQLKGWATANISTSDSILLNELSQPNGLANHIKTCPNGNKQWLLARQVEHVSAPSPL